MHDILSGKALSGILHFYNKTPVDWYCKCKKQATTETATYGSEFTSCHTWVEHVVNVVCASRCLADDDLPSKERNFRDSATAQHDVPDWDAVDSFLSLVANAMYANQSSDVGM